MRPSKFVKCTNFPCLDIIKERYVVPDIEIEPEKIRAIMISEAPPQEANDYFYAQGKSFFHANNCSSLQ